MSSIQPSTSDIQIRKYRTFSREFEFTDGNDVALDLTSYFITAQVREQQNYNSDLIIAFDVDKSQALTGIITISLTEDVTGSLTNSSGYWDMLFESTGEKESWLEGRVEISESITHIS